MHRRFEYNHLICLGYCSNQHLHAVPGGVPEHWINERCQTVDMDAVWQHILTLIGNNPTRKQILGKRRQPQQQVGTTCFIKTYYIE